MNRVEHLLTCLSEECDEVGQRVAKALRFSLPEVRAGQSLTNAEMIVDELHDLIAVATILEVEGVLVGVQPTADRIATKMAKIERYMDISRRYGALTEDLK